MFNDFDFFKYLRNGNMFDFMIIDFENSYEPPNRKALEEIIRLANKKISPLFDSISARNYNDKVALEIRPKVENLARVTFKSRTIEEVNRDNDFFINHEELYDEIFLSELISIQSSLVHLENENKEARSHIQYEVYYYFSNKMFENLKNNKWEDLKNFINIIEEATYYYDHRTNEQTKRDEQIETNKEDYIDFLMLALNKFNVEVKNKSKMHIYNKYKEYVEQHVFKTDQDIEYAHCDTSEIREIAQLFYQQRNAEEINRDEKFSVTVEDYKAWCSLVWEDIEDEREYKSDMETNELREEYNRINRSNNYSQYSKPSDGYGGYLDDDYINNVLGGEPDAHWNLD